MNGDSAFLIIAFRRPVNLTLDGSNEVNEIERLFPLLGSCLGKSPPSLKVF